ncbi:C40 family peptidase [Streptomyces sp. SP17BM10]|uniref:C40 family peptidase n=1 Tax=Streptomyces sp. SP17BM10 TaxID=3002530 RepID=UPI002E769FE5|nr:C40 family peptidase [Streptomyces sp. SP17BM10]MEE1783937.1 C40 family peptidase [Streptomyces sp. SP17BM10]
MRIATGAYAGPGSAAADVVADVDGDFGTIGFEESSGGIPAIAGCGCPNCAPRPRPRTARSGAEAGGSRIHRAVRSTCLATTVLAGAGVVGLTAGAGSAHAEAGKQGWDGSRYWFKGVKGDWRWTSHSDVYASRTGRSAKSGESGASGGSGSKGGQSAGSDGQASPEGLRQGWDGSRYWFKGVNGDWRWTSHYDVYLNRVGRSGGFDAAPSRPSSDDGADGSTSSGSTESAIDYALAQLGKPYVWGGDGPSGYDCSGLVQQAYRRSGISLPRVADDQYAATTPIGAGQLRRGDLVFWSDSGRASGIHHVGIYLGDGTFVEAPRPGKTVRVSSLNAGYYPTHFGRP